MRPTLWLLPLIGPNGRCRLPGTIAAPAHRAAWWPVLLDHDAERAAIACPACRYPSGVKAMRLRIPHMRTVAEIVGAMLLLSAGAASAAAIIPAAAKSTTIQGCENTKTGALSVRLHATCPSGTKPISWNITGPAGPPGTTGIFGSKTNTAGIGSGSAQCTLGEVILTAGSTAPGGTVLANGQLLPISGNVALFSLLSTRYGGNGKTTFALPNLKKAAPNGLTYSICEYNSVYP